MLNYLWPIMLVVLSNVIYHICAKSVPGNVNPFASLFVTYVIGAVSSAVMYFLLNKDADLFKEISKMNWTSYVLGFVILGLEVGYLYAYKAGWQISTAAIVQSSFLAIILLFVGLFFFNEPLSWNKTLGLLICLVGLVFINLK